MSWFFGAIGEISPADRRRLGVLSSNQALFSQSSEHFFLAAGGIDETCSYHSEAERGHVVCGKGIAIASNGSRFLLNEDWRDLLDSGNDRLTSIDGHFAAIHWQGGTYRFLTDGLGIRDITLYQQNGVLYFTTNETILPLLRGHSHDIDWQTFSGRWLLATQLSLGSSLAGSIRLVAGRSAALSNGALQVDPIPSIQQLLQERPTAQDEIAALLSSFIELPRHEGKNLHIALSGGMDSRIILSFLLAKGNTDFESHTYVDSSHPDALITKKMAADLHFRHDVRAPATHADDTTLVEQLRNYCAQKKATTSLTSFLPGTSYDELRNIKDLALVDGGFGEIGRRRIFEQLRLRGRKEILSNDPFRLYGILSRSRADIFSDSFQEELIDSAKAQIADYLASVPHPGDIGVEQWLDILAIRTMLPNYIGFVQARQDQVLYGYSPFVQPSFIRAILACPIPLRRNGNLYRKILAANFPALGKYPLVRFEATYPSRFGAMGAYLWTSVKRKLGMAFVSHDQVKLLQRLETFAKDTAASRSAREFAPYEQKKIQAIITKFYSGEHQYASELDWWLSFELWRQSLTP